MTTQATLELGQEYPPPEEQEAIQKVTQAILNQLNDIYPAETKPVRRGQHPKSHGCVKAEFTVHDNLPEQLRCGIFKNPQTYNAWIRFSPSAPTIRSDAKKDAHGMAIKLVGVEGEKILETEKQAKTHDFLLVNSESFFIRNAADYVLFSEAFTTNNLINLIGFFFSWNPLKWRIHELSRLLQITQKGMSHPLKSRYWSQVPYKLGSHAVKYSAKPCSEQSDPIPSSPSFNYFEEAMAKQLSDQDVYFDFMIQVQTDPVKMPVEDSTIIWDENLSPFKKVATIHIPVQNFTTPERREFAENLSFTPWHALPEHRPLGSMNRVRRQVYETIARTRHQRNNEPYQEPTGDELV